MQPLICYRLLRGWKYRLQHDYLILLKLPPREVNTRYLHYSAGGLLTIRQSYAWDGPSGPTVDTKSFMRGSLVHDALYQLLRMEELRPTAWWRTYADQLLRLICLEDGMSRVRAWYVYWAVHLFAARHAKPRKGTEVFLYAP